MRFTGKTAIVTGGASGIGAATAHILATEGAKVMVADIHSRHDSEAVTYQEIDISDGSQVDRFVADVLRRLGTIDILVNCAGIGGMGRTVDIEADLWRRVMAVNLDGVFNLSRAVLPVMIENGGGSIVNIASISGLGGDYGMAAYCAAKGAVINFTRAMAVDHAQSSIRVNAIAPGLIDTPLLDGVRSIPGLFDTWTAGAPMRRAGRPEEIAEVVAFLSSEAASFMTGAIVAVDGGVSAHTGQPDLGNLIAQLQANYA